MCMRIRVGTNHELYVNRLFLLYLYLFTFLSSVEVMFSNKALQVILHEAVGVVVTACVFYLLTALSVSMHSRCCDVVVISGNY